MAASDDLRFQCYYLEGQDDAEIFAVGAHSNQKQFLIGAQALCDEEEKHIVLWDAESKSIIGKEIIWVRPNPHLPVRFTGIEISEHSRGQGASIYLHQACIRYMQELGFKGFVEANIDKDKTPSMKAAIKVGFRESADHQNYVTLKREIEELKCDRKLRVARQVILEDPKPRVESW